MKNKKNGFTLVEILIVMAILLIMVTITVGILNSVGITNKGRDAKTKKDLNRIKIAFEEYFNDKGEYPQDVDTWNIGANCNSGTFSPYLTSWPCDSNNVPYKIFVEKNNFRIVTNLGNKTDKDIPSLWYERKDFVLMGLTKNDINYGVSSSNVLWYDIKVNPVCDTNTCLSNLKGGCNSVSEGCHDNNCYYWNTSNGGSCTAVCKTICCGGGGDGFGCGN